MKVQFRALIKGEIMAENSKGGQMRPAWHMPPMTPCCFREDGKACTGRAYYKTTNITDGDFEVCRKHVKVLDDKGVICVPIGKTPLEGESTETIVRRAEYLREREKQRKVNKKKGVSK